MAEWLIRSSFHQVAMDRFLIGGGSGGGGDLKKKIKSLTSTVMWAQPKLSALNEGPGKVRDCHDLTMKYVVNCISQIIFTH